jgi:PKD repeat protein
MARGSIVACVVVTLLAVVGPACHEETVTAPTLSATCEARPSVGQVPLTVSFLLTVSGAQGSFNVAVSYGDGTGGTSADVPHTYSAEGVFTAAFTVTTATQSARCSTAVTVMPNNTGPTPPPGGNQPPHAVFKSTPDAVGRGSTISGAAPLSVRFNMCATSDPEGDPLWFTMDFDGDGIDDSAGTTGAKCRKDFVYAAGTWKARNCVHDMDAHREALHDDQCHTYSVVVTP